jgi:hypothetical protein
MGAIVWKGHGIDSACAVLSALGGPTKQGIPRLSLCSSVVRKNQYRLALLMPPRTISTATTVNPGDAVSQLLLFYAVRRSGPLPTGNRVIWRRSSALCRSPSGEGQGAAEMC